MTKRLFFKISSIITSCVSVGYCLLVIVLCLKNNYTMSIKTSTLWMLIPICVGLINAVFTILSQSRIAHLLSMLAIFPLIVFIRSKIRFVILAIYLVAYIIHKKWSVKIIGTLFCVLMVLLRAWIANSEDIFLVNYALLENNYYKSPSGEIEIETKVYLRDYDETYSYGVTAHKQNALNLGLIAFQSNDGITSADQLYEKPKIEIKWISNDAFLINGKEYIVEDYVN